MFLFFPPLASILLSRNIRVGRNAHDSRIGRKPLLKLRIASTSKEKFIFIKRKALIFMFVVRLASCVDSISQWAICPDIMIKVNSQSFSLPSTLRQVWVSVIMDDVWCDKEVGGVTLDNVIHIRDSVSSTVRLMAATSSMYSSRACRSSFPCVAKKREFLQIKIFYGHCLCTKKKTLKFTQKEWKAARAIPVKSAKFDEWCQAFGSSKAARPSLEFSPSFYKRFLTAFIYITWWVIVLFYDPLPVCWPCNILHPANEST